MLTIESLCTLNVELKTTGATFVQFSLSSNLETSASVGAQYIRTSPFSPGAWDWVNNVTWADDPVRIQSAVGTPKSRLSQLCARPLGPANQLAHKHAAGQLRAGRVGRLWRDQR